MEEVPVVYVVPINGPFIFIIISNFVSDLKFGGRFMILKNLICSTSLNDVVLVFSLDIPTFQNNLNHLIVLFFINFVFVNFRPQRPILPNFGDFSYLYFSFTQLTKGMKTRFLVDNPVRLQEGSTRKCDVLIQNINF
jgi:hypothetical protein